MKWPNDLVVGDRKLAGILAEADGAGAVVVGMGLNVRADAFPPELARDRDRVRPARAAPVDRDELLVAWLRALDARLDALDDVVARRGRALGDARPARARRARARDVRRHRDRADRRGLPRRHADDGTEQSSPPATSSTSARRPA